MNDLREYRYNMNIFLFILNYNILIIYFCLVRIHDKSNVFSLKRKTIDILMNYIGSLQINTNNTFSINKDTYIYTGIYVFV